MTRTLRQDGVSPRRLVTLGLVALGLALLTVARMGVSEALAFAPARAAVGTVVPAYASRGAIVCTSGTVAIAANTLWIADPRNYGWPQYNISHVRYGVWLYRWSGSAWAYTKFAGDGEQAATPLNQQMTFSGLAKGSYTVWLQFRFDDAASNNLGYSDWVPTAFDFYYTSGNYNGTQYCTI
jgi:hypothetical protein